ncbi:amidohydrolase family protein [Hyphococcus lacteus]|uniref:Amidohydrolase family protein n=1 Tax=Hyphococcus lacteus TaxID=3143536 RepID=A0ABV3ZBL2_9PROT
MIRCVLIALITLIMFLSPAMGQEFAVVDVRAYTMESEDVAEPIDNATILVRDGRIISVVAAGDVPDGVRTINGGNSIVTPGLFNAATKLGLQEMSGAPETVDYKSADSDLTVGFDPSLAVNQLSTAIVLARADGMTNAFLTPNAGKDPLFGGYGAVIRLGGSRNIEVRAKAGVLAYVSGDYNRDGFGSRAVLWQRLRGELTEARGELSCNKTGKKGDIGDLPLGKSNEKALELVLCRTVPLVLFTDRESDLRQLIELASDYNIRSVVVGGAQAWQLADKLADAEISVIVTPSVNIPSSFDEIGVRSDNISILNAAGVDVMIGQVAGNIGSTYNAGLGLRMEAATAVVEGLDWYEALRAVTVVPNRVFGSADGAGTLVSGAPADFVLWSGDPFEASTNAHAVFVAGHEMPLETRQDMLGQRYMQGQ